MKRIFIMTCILSLSMGVYAQKEANWWYFGYGSGLNFNVTQTINNYVVPTSVQGPLSTYEGSFSISHPLTGEFLMASDGMTVYNGALSTDIIEDGKMLKGHPSATQSGIIIPRPEHSGIYYVVTIDAIRSQGGHGYGINYTEVDMAGNNGKGKITIKNKSVCADLFENIATIQSYDDINYWLVHRSPTSFMVWKVTKEGIAATPTVISAEFTLNVADEQQLPGYLKFSPDGRYIAHVGGSSGRLVLGKFDTKTGDITDIVVKNTGEQLYGLEFSPSGDYIYVSSLGNLFRYPTSSLSTAIATKKSGNYRTLQLGPDNRIYMASNTAKSIHFIPEPEENGATINVQTLNNYLKASSHSWGLPTFINSFFEISSGITTTPTDICRGTEATISVDIMRGNGNSRIEFVRWDFGDGSPHVDDNDWSMLKHSVKHTYEKSGKYTITITPYKDAAGQSPIVAKTAQFKIKINTCLLPVNPNIQQY